MHLLQRHLDDLLDSNAYSIALIKEEVGLVKQDLEWIRNIEQEWYKDLWPRVLDVAYEAKHTISSILVKDNGLLHFIYSLSNATKKDQAYQKKSILHEKTVRIGPHCCKTLPTNQHQLIINNWSKNIAFSQGSGLSS